MIICVLPIEDVLSQSHDLKSSPPQKWARPLYDGLHTQYRMLALTVATDEVADWWLQQNYLKDWSGVLTKPDAYNNYNEWKVRQVEEFLAEGWEVGLFIDTEVWVCDEVNRLGVMTMRLSQPTSRVGWKPPDQPIRGWSEIAGP
jgi:hypothetical protein